MGAFLRLACRKSLRVSHVWAIVNERPSVVGLLAISRHLTFDSASVVVWMGDAAAESGFSYHLFAAPYAHTGQGCPPISVGLRQKAW